MVLTFNCDAQEIKNFEITDEGYMKLWISIATANHDLHYRTDAGEVIEFITKENLFKKENISAAVGKHLALNHPPEPINGTNWRTHSVGSLLQEYIEDGDNLVMSAIIYDPEIIKNIQDKKYRFTSSAYTATKKPINQDGKIEQITRVVNHVGILDESHVPRAGESSRLIIVGGHQKDSKNSTIDVNTQNSVTNTANDHKTNMNTSNDKKTNTDSGLAPKQDMQLLVKLHKEYDEFLETNGKTIDYNADASTIKRLVLSCLYPEETVKQLNSDALLDGFWLSFDSHFKDDLITQKQQEIELSTFNKDSNNKTVDFRQQYINKLTGVK